MTIVAGRKNDFGGLPKWAFWERLKRKRPVAYEALQWGMFAVAAGALAASFLR